MPNWAEQVTAIATAVSALGLLSAIGAVIFAARQAREARIGREAATAVEFFRRWNEAPLVLATSLFGDVAAALREHGSAALDEHRCYLRWECDCRKNPGCHIA